MTGCFYCMTWKTRLTRQVGLICAIRRRRREGWATRTMLARFFWDCRSCGGIRLSQKCATGKKYLFRIRRIGSNRKVRRLLDNSYHLLCETFMKNDLMLSFCDYWLLHRICRFLIKGIIIDFFTCATSGGTVSILLLRTSKLNWRNMRTFQSRNWFWNYYSMLKTPLFYPSHDFLCLLKLKIDVSFLETWHPCDLPFPRSTRQLLLDYSASQMLLKCVSQVWSVFKSSQYCCRLWVHFLSISFEQIASNMQSERP